MVVYSFWKAFLYLSSSSFLLWCILFSLVATAPSNRKRERERGVGGFFGLLLFLKEVERRAREKREGGGGRGRSYFFFFLWQKGSDNARFLLYFYLQLSWGSYCRAEINANEKKESVGNQREAVPYLLFFYFQVFAVLVLCWCGWRRGSWRVWVRNECNHRLQKKKE